MPTYLFEGSLVIKRVHSPGTYLRNRDDIYLYINIFDNVHFTKLSVPSFPLEIHESFTFEKRFFETFSPYELCRKLEDIPVTIELRQVTEYFNSGKLLAYFDGNARDFFMPCPTLCSTMNNDRELLMIRTVDFAGVSPRIEFSTTTKISPTAYCPEKMTKVSKPSEMKGSASLSAPRYTQPTVNSILRSSATRREPVKKIRTSRSSSAHREYPPKRSYSPLRNSLNLPLSRVEKDYSCPRCSSDCICAMRRTRSHSSLHDLDLKAAQERSERYWQLYRFWQREVDNLRRSRG